MSFGSSVNREDPERKINDANPLFEVENSEHQLPSMQSCLCWDQKIN